MVSITNINAGQAEHYYAKDDYYSRSGGQWLGKGAGALGLGEDVKAEDFQRLLSGKDRHGNDLVQPGPGGHRAGIDLTFSAPKSVSILSHVVGDERLKEAHKKAVSATLSHIEEHYSHARETKSGETKKIETGNLVIAAFNHHTSRELDPQSHTHAVIMNLTRQERGKWKALSNEGLYTNKMYIGQYYRNELAANLKELGYAVKADHRGLFEVLGVDRELLESFSRRSEQIDSKVSELKNSGRYPNTSEQKLREIAALGSRVSKRKIDLETIREAWKDRVKELGYSIEQLRESTRKAAPREPSKEASEYIRQAARIVTENESVFTREQILKDAGKLSLGDYRIADLEKAFAQARSKEIVRLGKNAYTTREMVRTEKDILRKVWEGWDKTAPLVATKEVGVLLKKHDYLTRGQAQAVEHILTSRDRIIGIQGDAGTGKTTALRVIRERLSNDNIELRGLGFTGKSAEEVEKNAGIASQTVDSFLYSEKSCRMAGMQVWIVDEASMLGSRKMHALLEKAERADAKVALIGDVKQLQAIEAGRMFGKLQETGALRTVEMKETLRQQETTYRDTIKDISAKKIEAAFGKLELKNRLIEAAGRDERLAAIVKDFMGYPYRKTLIVTARNADRNELNTMIRGELKARGTLHGDDRVFTVRERKGINGVERHFAQSYQPGDVVYAQKAGILGRAGAEARVTEVNDTNHILTVETRDGQPHQISLGEHGEHLSVYREKEQGFTTGDRIIFCKNDKALHVKNGVTATIKGMDERGNITAVTDSGKRIEFNAARYQYFDAGYAVTDYKSQGQTSRNVIYHALTQDASYNQFYTAITRGKEDVRVYTDNKIDLKEQVRNEQFKTSTLDYREIGDLSRDKEKEPQLREPRTGENRDMENVNERSEKLNCNEQEKNDNRSRDMEREFD